MLNRLPLTLLTGFAFFVGLNCAEAAIYVCKENGRTRTSDRPITNCNSQSELNRDGSVRREVQSEGIRSKAGATEAPKVDNERAELAREHQRLLDAYGSEDAIERARKRALEGIDAEIYNAKKRLDFQKSSLESMTAPKANAPTKPGSQAARWHDLVNAMKQEETIIARKTQERASVNERLDNDLKRWRELEQSRGTGSRAP